MVFSSRVHVHTFVLHFLPTYGVIVRVYLHTVLHLFLTDGFVARVYALSTFTHSLHAVLL